MTRRNRTGKNWSFRKCGPSTVEVHTNGSQARTARNLPDLLNSTAIYALRIVKDTGETVVLRMPNQRLLKTLVARALSRPRLG